MNGSSTEPRPDAGAVRWTLYLTFSGAIVFFLYVGEGLFSRSGHSPIRMGTYIVVALLGAWALLGPQSLMNKLVKRASADAALRVRLLHIRYVILLGMAASLVLWGVLVRLLGGTRLQALPFYLIGCLVLIAAWPTRIFAIKE